MLVGGNAKKAIKEGYVTTNITFGDVSLSLCLFVRRGQCNQRQEKIPKSKKNKKTKSIKTKNCF